MRLSFPTNDEERRIQLEDILLAARPEHGTALVQLDPTTLTGIQSAHDDLVTLLAEHAALDKRVDITQERLNGSMPKVRSMLSAYWAAMRSLQKQSDRVIDFESVYGLQPRSVSRMRDLDVVRALDKVVQGLHKLTQTNPPQEQDQGTEAKEVADKVPVIAIFKIDEVEAALVDLEKDLLFISEVRSQRKARTTARTQVRKHISLLLRQVAGRIRLESLEDSRVDTREKMRAFGFRFLSDKTSNDTPDPDDTTTSVDDILADALSSQG